MSSLLRDGLVPHEGQRIRVRAKIERYGSSPEGSRYLLVNVCDVASGALLTDHLWMPIGNWAWSMRAGDVIAFDATVAAYVKGYQGRRWDAQIESPLRVDLHLANPSNGEILEQGPIPRMR